MEGYPTIVRTGSHELDVQTVEQHRRTAAAQGIVLFVQPLPGGGFQLTVSAPPGAIGATMPSKQPGSSPQRAVNVAITPAAPDASFGDPGGTLPSRFASFPYALPAAAPLVEVILRPGEGYCEACRRVGPVRQAHFMQNIGAVVLRFPRTISGQLCKFCIDKYFFRFTAVTMLLGWWGVISFFYSLVAIPANVISWTGSLGMVTPQPDVDSFREKRTRASVAVAVGALASAVALLTLALGALAATIGEDKGVVALAVMGSIVGGVAAVILLFGIRARVRATGGLRRLGAR